MKKISSLFIILSTLILISCSNDFGDKNIDPNKPSQASPESLLTGAMASLGKDLAAIHFGDRFSTEHSTLWVDYVSKSEYTGYDFYSDVFAYSYKHYYQEPISNLNEVIAATKNENLKQVAIIVKALVMSYVTDAWGDVPYSEAGLGATNLYPKFESQELIYKDILNNLKTAIDTLDDTKAFSGDILLGNSVAEWKKLANSLIVVFGLRIYDSVVASSSADAISKTELETLLKNAASGDLITSTLNFPYQRNQTYENLYFKHYDTDGYDIHQISEEIVRDLKTNADLRLFKFARKTPNVATSTTPLITEACTNISVNYNALTASDYEAAGYNFEHYCGVPSGLSATAIGELTGLKGQTSKVGSVLSGQDSPLPILSVAQVHFSLAELAVRGIISGNAETHYNNAIDASYQQFGIETSGALYDNFKRNVAFPSNGTLKEKLFAIGNQKWIAMFPNGMQAWSHYRRTCSPVLKVAPGSESKFTFVARRMPYPFESEVLNPDSFATVAEEDNFSSPVSWDVPSTDWGKTQAGCTAER